MRVLLLDNYDSFTFNVADQLARLGASVEVVRNDAEDVGALLARGADAIVISPGPGAPDAAGATVELVHAAIERDIPLLGICLGMQGIAHALGGRVIRLPGIVVHGAASPVLHDGAGIYGALDAEFDAGRYHSLVVDETTLGSDLMAVAHTSDGVLMGIRHRSRLVEGVQFHPESILTPHGDLVVERFLQLAAVRVGIEAPRRLATEVA